MVGYDTYLPSDQGSFSTGKKTTGELKRCLYRLKEEVYCSDQYNLSHNTSVLDSLLTDIIGSSSVKMHDVKEPK